MGANTSLGKKYGSLAKLFTLLGHSHPDLEAFFQAAKAGYFSTLQISIIELCFFMKVSLFVRFPKN